MDITVNGHRLYCEAGGPEGGPAVILLHHGLGSTRAWKAQTPALADAGYRVIVYDRWGYGGSDPRQGLSMPYFREDLLDLQALMDQLEIERASLIGHSDGGTISLYMAAGEPQRVRNIVVVAAHIYVEKKMVSGIEGVRASFERDERFRKGLERLHADKTESVFWGWYRGWADERNLDWDMRPLLGHIKRPALVAQGLQDEHAESQHALDLAGALPNAVLWLEAGAAHMLPQERPAEFNRRVLAFLNRNRG